LVWLVLVDNENGARFICVRGLDERMEMGRKLDGRTIIFTE